VTLNNTFAPPTEIKTHMTRSYFMTAALMAMTFGAVAQVSVRTKIPSSVAPGQEFTVEMNISKGDVSGFAKLQHDLPTGFNAVAGETANSTFSFKDRKVKFLWMSLPAASDLTVTYKVKVDAGMTGNQILEGNFSYIRNNETEKFTLPKDIIVVSDQPATAQQAANQQIVDDQRKKQEAAEAARLAAAEAERKAAEASKPVEKESPKQETTPVASSSQPAAEADNSAADAEKAKKAEEERAAAAERDAKAKAERDAKAQSDRDAKAASDLAAAEAKRQKEEAKRAESAAAKQTSSASSESAMLKSVPGLVFRVQVAAGANNVDPSSFASKFNIKESVSVEEHDGMFKYVVGEFGSYRPAKTFCNDLRDNNSVEGPFVTAYNNGVRIHVREALDLLGQ